MRTYSTTKKILWACVIITIMTMNVQAAQRSTVAAGLWTNAAIWTDGILPQGGDDVSVDHAVTLDQSTPGLNSFVNNAEFTFEGWNTQLQATEVTVNANITHPVQSDTNGTIGVYSSWTPDNRVWIVCSNLTVNASQSIDVNGKGYVGGVGGSSDGKGPGGGFAAAYGGGGGYGGHGGRSSGVGDGGIYGDQVTPMDPGSGGGAGGSQKNRPGGNGGGTIWIDASGLVTIDGKITANGGNVDTGTGRTGGGGSGGSILIDCVAIKGLSGVLSADGGRGGDHFDHTHGSDGGGGRIAITYDPTQQALQNQEAMPDIAISSAGGFRTFDVSRGEPGTVYVPDTSFFPSSTPGGVRLPGGIPSFTNWTPETLTIDNTWVMLGSETELDVLQDILITGNGGRLDVGEGSNNWTMVCGGNTIVTNGGNLHFRSAATNGVIPYGGLVLVDNELSVYSNSMIFVHSSPFNGGSVKIEAGQLFVNDAATISAAGLGFSGGITEHPEGFGPGGGGFKVAYGGGGGYGGQGGDSFSGAQGGIVYGSSNIVTQCGSGGAAARAEDDRHGGYGGGLIWIETTGETRVDGLLDVSGSFPTGTTGGGGSGGGIYLRCRIFSGDGELRAQGGDGDTAGGQWSGGGGGGRIAVWRTNDEWTGSLSWPDAVAGGLTDEDGSHDGQPGTIVLGNILPAGTLMLIQ